MEMQNVKNQAKKAFTPARIKKAAVLAMLVSLVSAGGAYYHHQQAQARSVAEKQARSEMITAQASQRGIVLIDEAHVRTIAADALGKILTTETASTANTRTANMTVTVSTPRCRRRDQAPRQRQFRPSPQASWQTMLHRQIPQMYR